MSDEFEISVPISMPLDSDGFLRRECPTCAEEFKWFSHDEGDTEAEQVDQYFCPLCGVPAGTDSWWTPKQLDYAQGAAGPEIDRVIGGKIEDMFNGIKGLTYKSNGDFSLDIPVGEPFFEPDDMVIVEPPCHPNEPLKVPNARTTRVHCLVCGSAFTA